MRRLTKVRRCCFIPGKPSLLERRRGMEQQRKRAKRAAPHLSMMARGGRENGAQRRNPKITNSSGEKYTFYLKDSAILSNNISSAGSHFTDFNVA